MPIPGNSLAAARSPYPFRYFSASRLPDVSTGNVHTGGGITIIIFDRDAKIDLLNSTHLGGLSVELSKPGHAPKALVGLYVPPTSSKYYSLAADLLTWAVAEVTNYSKRFGVQNVILAGDFNNRLTSYLHRRTLDATAASSGAAAAKRGGRRGAHASRTTLTPRQPPTDDAGKTPASILRLRKFFAALEFSPPHGRPGTEPGYITSRQINVPVQTGKQPRGAEVDYIAVSNSLDASTCHCWPPVSWDEIPSHITHRPVTVTIPWLPTTSTPTPSASAANLRPKPHWNVPVYSDTNAWQTMARSLQDRIPTVRATIASPASSLNACAQAFQFMLSDSMDATCAAHAEPARAPNGHVTRLYKGIPLPAATCILYDQARRLRHQLSRKQLLHEQRVQIVHELKQTRKEAKKQADAAVRKKSREIVRTLEHLRVHNPHKMAQYLNQLSPEDPHNHNDSDRHAPDEPGHPAAPERFYEHCRKLNQQRAPLPTALSSDEWLKHVPRGRGRMCRNGQPFDWQDVWMAIFPTSARFKPRACDTECIICTKFIADWESATADGTPLPPWKPCLQTSRACGPDFIKAEFIRFARMKDSDETHAFRLNMCTLIAELSNRLMSDPNAELPTDCLRGLVMPVPKGKKTTIAADPNLNRFITIGNLITKVCFELMLTTRLQHYALVNELISPTQIGNQQFLGSEHHVFTLRETLKALNRRGQAGYVVYLDLKKAYPSVHLDALWKVLELMGLPDNLVSFFKNYYGNRCATTVVNGIESPTYPTNKGVAEGASTSPIFWLLFYESFTRYLNSLPEYHGVTIDRAYTLKDLHYVDDTAATATSPAQAQLVLTAAHEWGQAWSVEINPGVEKTACQRVAAHETAAQRDAAFAQLPQLQCGPHNIPWTKMYKYLGSRVHDDLSLDDIAERLRNKLKRHIDRLFTYNKILTRCSVMLQLQVLNTFAISTVSYLIGVVRLTPTELQPLDAIIQSAARKILKLPGKAPSTLVAALSRIGSLELANVRERERFFYQVRLSPLARTAISTKVLKALQDERIRGHRGNWRRTMENFAHQTERARRAEAARRGVVHIVPNRYSSVTLAAHVTARHIVVANYCRLKERVLWRFEQRPAPHTLYTDAPPPGQLQHVWHMLGGFNVAHRLGPHRSTPLSAMGPSCSGSIIALCGLSAQVLAPIITAWRGRAALGKLPWHHRSRADRDAAKAQAQADSALAHARFPYGSVIPRAVTNTGHVPIWEMVQDERCQQSKHRDDAEHPEATLAPCSFCSAVYCSNCVPNIPQCRPLGQRYACPLCALEWQQQLQAQAPELLQLLTAFEPGAAQPLAPHQDAPDNDDADDDDDDADDDEGDGDAELNEFTHSRVVPFYSTSKLQPQCPLCKQAGEDPAHYILACNHPLLTAARTQVEASATDFAAQLHKLGSNLINHLHNRFPNAGYDHTPASLRLQQPALQWATPEGRFVLLKLLLTCTWPEASVPADAASAASFGRIFDHLYCEPSLLRKLARTWALWAKVNLLVIIDARRAAIGNLPLWKQRAIGTVVSL